MGASRIAVIGFGEVGSIFARDLAAGGATVCVYSRPRADLAQRVREAGATPVSTAAEAAAGTGVAFIALPADCDAVVEAVAGALPETSIAVDLSSAAPEVKARRARLGLATGYVDAAMLGTVAVSGLAVPIVASGARATELERFGAQRGMQISAIAGDPGQAARLKLVRSVYMKGRDALVVELLLAARRLGLEDDVVASIGGPGEQVPFAELVDRLVTGVAIHAQRRSDELSASADLLEAAGVAPVMARAGARVLADLGDLGLRESFAGRRPSDARRVLDEVERLRRRADANHASGGVAFNEPS